MSDAPAARGIAAAWALLVATSALYFLADNEADNDLWIHVFSGRQILAHRAVPRVDDLSYTAAGLPWIDHEWLTQIGFAACFDYLGPSGLWFGKLVIGLLTVWLVWLTVSRRSASWVRGAVMVLVLACLARGYAMRPQIVTYLGVAALLAGLDRLAPYARRRPAIMILLTGIGFALWANAHGGFIVGLGILALFAFLPRWPRQASSAPSADPAGEPVARDAGVPPATLRLAMLATAGAAACLTPYGLGLYGYVLTELRAPHPLTEWQPVQLGDPAQLPFLILLFVLLATLPFARSLRRQPWRAALVAVVAVMALRQQRHVPLFALFAAAPLAEQADAAMARLRTATTFRLSAVAARAVALGLVALALMQAGLLADRFWRAGGGIVYAADDYPVGALRFLHAHGLHGNLALPLDWGAYALWHAAPAVKVSLDGRFATVYPPRVVEDNFAFFRGTDGAEVTRLLDAYDTTLVLVPRGTPSPIDRRADWRVLYSDAIAALFAKTGAPADGPSDAPRGWLSFP